MRKILCLACMLIGVMSVQANNVNYTVDYNVESNFDIPILRQQFFDKKDTTTFIISHRGDWHGTAENSLHSIQKAIEKGCAGVEVDVRQTKDGTLVLMADETVDRMTDGTGRIADLTLSEIRKLHLREYHGELTSLWIPTLEEALMFCKGKILVAVSNYNDYAREIDALVKKTGTEAEFFSLRELPRKIAYTWRETYEQQSRPDRADSPAAHYAQLQQQGYTVFVSDAPKALNTFLDRSHVMASIAVSEVFGDGQKVSCVVLRYGQDIDGRSVTKDSYQVEGHTVVDAFTSTTEDMTGKAVSGRDVVICLDTALHLDAALPSQAKTETKDKKEHAIPAIVAGNRPERKENPFPTDVYIKQVLPVSTTSGRHLMEAYLLRNTIGKTLIVDDFKQTVYRDTVTGDTLRYNIYLPKDYTANAKYPIVLFMHDASCSGQEDTYTLRQGLGATVWASPEEQAKHPCIVIAPQYDEVVTDDCYDHTASAERTAALLQYIIKSYAVDSSRVYVTGQSMGCMLSYFLMSHYPDLFTAGLLVAGHWDASELSPMSHKPLWLVSSAGKSQSGAEGAIKVWQENGGVAASAEWPVQAASQERNAMTADLLNKGGNIHYSHLTSGSHFDTWRVAYNFEGVRDWLFRQHK